MLPLCPKPLLGGQRRWFLIQGDLGKGTVPCKSSETSYATDAVRKHSLAISHLFLLDLLGSIDTVWFVLLCQK